MGGASAWRGAWGYCLPRTRYVPVPYGAMLPREADNLLVCEVAERLGYQNYRSFSAAFEKYYHCNPKKYKG